MPQRPAPLRVVVRDAIARQCHRRTDTPRRAQPNLDSRGSRALPQSFGHDRHRALRQNTTPASSTNAASMSLTDKPRRTSQSLTARVLHCDLTTRLEPHSPTLEAAHLVPHSRSDLRQYRACRSITVAVSHRFTTRVILATGCRTSPSSASSMINCAANFTRSLRSALPSTPEIKSSMRFRVVVDAGLLLHGCSFCCSIRTRPNVQTEGCFPSFIYSKFRLMARGPMPGMRD